MKKTLLISTIVALMGTTPAFAYFSIDSLFSNGFYNMHSFFSNTSTQAGMVLLMFFVLLFSILTVAIKQVKIFQKGDTGSNNQGKAVAFVIALSGTIGLFFSGPLGFYETSRRFLQATSVYGMVALGALTFFITYYGLKPTEGTSKAWWFIGSVGLAIMLPAYFFDKQALFDTGITLVVIAAIFVIIAVIRGGEESSSE